MNDKPTITSTDVALLQAILEPGTWMLAREIAAHPRWQEAYPPREHQSSSTYLAASERKVRAIANSSGGSVLSYPGSPGYRLRRAASADEVKTAIAKLRHQSAEMHARATSIENFHADAETQLTLV